MESRFHRRKASTINKNYYRTMDSIRVIYKMTICPITDPHLLVFVSVGLLRVPGMVDGAARHPPSVHFPSVPFGSDSGRDLEDQLQTTYRHHSLLKKTITLFSLSLSVSFSVSICRSRYDYFQMLINSAMLCYLVTSIHWYVSGKKTFCICFCLHANVSLLLF